MTGPRPLTRRPPPDPDVLVEGVLRGERASIGRAITLIESRRDDHQNLALRVLEGLMPKTGAARRIGISGVPGVGKSTFIERFGMQLVDAGHRVAVLAVDPSSAISGGSILGDKTRMRRLATDERAFVRPSPSGGALGGVARATRDTMLVCEAAGFDVVLVETVGVGQSEMVVAEMVDAFVVLMLTGAGDDLQGIKRGILEIADVIAINKADGDNRRRAERARHELEAALHFMRPRSPHWRPPVLAVSALEGRGLDELWSTLREHRRAIEASGELAARRAEQNLAWMWRIVESVVMESLRTDPQVRAVLDEVRDEVIAGRVPSVTAARRVIDAYRGRSR